MTTIEHYLAARIQTMAAMFGIAAEHLHAAGDEWAAGECEREAQHGREAIGVLSATLEETHPGSETEPARCVSPAGSPTSR